ncbi:MAG: tetratricopeptide repeat protein [Allosphingosinicella sp.]
MAIKPKDNDTFLREVDDELRKERMNRFVAQYGWALIAGLLLFLGAICGWIWWQDRQQQQSADQGDALITALDSLEAGNTKAAEPKVEQLVQSGSEGYRLSALFTRANMQVQSGNRAAAVQTLKSIADDNDAAEPFRQAALVRQTALEFDSLRPQVVVQRLGALARPGEPWFGSAGEMVAVAYLKMGQNQRAGQLFQRIGQDETVPPTLRTRAVQMAGSLGFNALEEQAAPGAAPPAAQAPAPATKE